MKNSTQDKLKGLGKQVSGKAKIAAGKVTGNTGLKAKGTAEVAVGKIQKKMGDAASARGR